MGLRIFRVILHVRSSNKFNVRGTLRGVVSQVLGLIILGNSFFVHNLSPLSSDLGAEE